MSVVKKGWDTAVCVASGPSLSKEQIEIISNPDRDYKIFVVSNNYELIPDADVLFSADSCWWLGYYDQAVEACSKETEFWTSNSTKRSMGIYRKRLSQHMDKELNGIEVVLKGQGINPESDAIYHGGNSGFMTVSLAHKMGCKKIILVGYDFQHTGNKTHWFGDHDRTKLKINAANPHVWVRPIQNLTKQLHENGVQVLNATIETAIEDTEHCRRVNLEDVL